MTPLIFSRSAGGNRLGGMRMVARLSLLPGLAAAVATACTGSIGDDVWEGEAIGPRNPGEPGVSSPLDPSSGARGPGTTAGAPEGAAAATAAACRSDLVSRDLPLRRLSARQFANNVAAAVAQLLPAQAPAVM